MRILALLITVYVLGSGVRCDECAPRDYGEGSVVCVCNATYCDKLDPITNIPIGQYLIYSSSKDGLRFHKTFGTFSINNISETNFVVNRSILYQEVFGFGGAMTDAAGINIASLSKETQDQLLKSYFSPEGLQFNLLRVPMAGCDFSTHPYSYDDVENDTTLQHFNLTEEDYVYKIPYIKRAVELNPRRILLLAAPWSAPKWMKTNNDFIGQGQLKKEYYQLWADYYIRFFEEYSQAGLNFWGVSSQNEPRDGFMGNFTFNNMGWTAEDQRDWVADHLGPTLESSDFNHVKLFLFDDQRIYMVDWANVTLSNDTVRKYASGMAVHWYTDRFFPAPTPLTTVHNLFPDSLLLYTEACNGLKQIGEVPVALGSWIRAEQYAQDIIETMNNWVTGWFDWNLALDETGGINWANNNVDSAVIVNATNDEFYKQPLFYALGHFSKFVTEGSRRIHLVTADDQGIYNIAFITPENYTVVVLLNRNEEEVNATLTDPDRGSMNVLVGANSIHTILYW